MVLNVPNMRLNETGGDTIYCVMTGCDVVYALCFRDGTPRRVTISMTLRQIVQTNTGIKFRGFGAAPAKYDMGDDEDLSNNSGRKMNGLSGME